MTPVVSHLTDRAASQLTDRAVTELADRAEITSLLSRYFSAIDDKHLDRATLEAMFTTNGASLIGPEAITAGQNESFARLRANLSAMHLWAEQERDPNTLQTHFLAGGVLHVLAVRTGQGWRFSELSMRNTWRTGTGYAAMLATGK
jgi:hypothetical protein